MASEPDGRARDVASSGTPDVRRLLISGLALAPAGANVIMQLSRLPVGHAIVESKVESGSLRRHPVKRTRTTLAYIMIALFGTEHERSVMRREVNAQHRQVHSTEDDALEYDARDPELQLWVAACMFRGVIDAVTILDGPIDDETFATLLRRCAPFATTLQVHELSWPIDRAAFDDYWDAAVRGVAMDDVTREYLQGLAALDFLPSLLARVFGPAHRFLTVGFLPSPFREELGLPWSAARQARFDTIITYVALVNRHLPTVLREFPWNLVQWDTKRRIARGRDVV